MYKFQCQITILASLTSGPRAPVNISLKGISNRDMQNLVKFKGKENRLDNIRIPTMGGVLSQLVNNTNVHVLTLRGPYS